MKILAFDTCFSAISAAARWPGANGEPLLREAYEAIGIGHAERILPLIDEVMAGAGLAFNELDRIAVTVGPGSFTGLRAGIAAARALALAIDRPIVGLSSLAVMAERAAFLLGDRRAARPIVVAVDARRALVYIQAFNDGAMTPLSAPALLPLDAAASTLPYEPVIVVGSGADAVAAAARRTDVEVALPDLQPHARQLVQLSLALDPLPALVPLYLREADAKPPTTPAIPRRADQQ